jgi:urease accessory protein
VARLATEADPRGRTRVQILRSGWPLMLRTTLPREPDVVTGWVARDDVAQVHLTAAGAGPIGGDRLRLEVRVGQGSALILGEVSPTLLLPGPHGERSRTEIDIHVAAGATLAWLPELVIAAQDCRHRTDIRVTLHAGARLLLREEILFGRHQEQPGTFRQRLRIVRDHRPLYDQELAVGPGTPGWDGPAVTAGHRSAGTLLVVDPDGSAPAPATARAPHTAVMALAGPATMTSTLAPDTATLRRRLDTALARIVTGRRQATAQRSPRGAGPAGIRVRVPPRRR